MKYFALKKRQKEPLVTGWQDQAANFKPEQYQQWIDEGYNVGCATGAVSGVFVLDCDSLLARLEVEQLGVPETYTVKTPRGYHLYFIHPNHKVSNHAGARFWEHLRYAGDAGIEGLDIRGDGGYVVAAGSIYEPDDEQIKKGKLAGSYNVECNVPIAHAPKWLLDRIKPKEENNSLSAAFSPSSQTSPYGQRALNDEIGILSATPSGSVNNQINISAFAVGQLVAGGEISKEDALSGLNDALAILGVAKEEKAQGTMQRGFEAGMQAPRKAPDTKAASNEEKLFGTRDGSAPATSSIIEADNNNEISTVVTTLNPISKKVKFIPEHKPKFVTGSLIPEYFAGCVYICANDQIFTPSGVSMNKSAFDAVYGGPQFPLDNEGSSKTRSAWEMFRCNGQFEMPKVWKTLFRPELPAGQVLEMDGLRFLNTYVPIEVPEQEGDPSPFLEHVKKLLPDGEDAEKLLHWMSAIVQNIGKKAHWWPVIQGVKGNGKSLLLSVMTQAIGQRYTHIFNPDTLIKTGNQFNDWIEGKLLIGSNEVKSSDGNYDLVETLKDTVTDSRIAVEGKGRAATVADNRANGMLLTNHRDACPVDRSERRWAVFYTAQQDVEDLIRDGMDNEYFLDLYNWMESGGYAIVTHYLKHKVLDDRLNPFIGQRRAPRTTTTDLVISETRNGLQQEIIEAIEQGLPYFTGCCVSASAVKNLANGLRRTVSPRGIRTTMESLGYYYHPALAANNGRSHRALSDGTKPVLYFKKGSDVWTLKDKSKVVDRAEAGWSGRSFISDNISTIPNKR